MRTDHLDNIAESRKVNRAPEDEMRCLSSSKAYQKKRRKTIAQMMRFQQTTNLHVDTLESKEHWATLEELLECHSRLTTVDLICMGLFIKVYIFIKVKVSRPKTIQYLKIETVNTAKTNGGFMNHEIWL